MEQIRKSGLHRALVLSVLLWSAGFALPSFSAEDKWAPEALRMNQIQVIGTHNSYHLSPPEAFLSVAGWVHEEVRAWAYDHAPLDIQLDRGVRSFELDLYHFAEGYQVFHVPLFDNGSSCKIFLDCLHLVKSWSQAHPGHVPISFLLEIKEREAKLAGDLVLPIDRWALDRLDRAIRSVFNADELIRPDDIREDEESLEKAVLNRGWPTLSWARNRVMFILHEGGRFRDLYTEGRPSLEGAVMFVRSEAGRPDAATLVMDNPFSPKIQARVQEGYWVRTRVDANRRNINAQKTARLEQAFSSGAQILSTDFPPGEADPKTGYVVEFASRLPARKNPVNAHQRNHSTSPLLLLPLTQY